MSWKQRRRAITVRLANSQNMLCYICKCKMSWQYGKDLSVTIDHIKPRFDCSPAEYHSPENKAAACYLCNQRKGIKEYYRAQELLKWRRLYGMDSQLHCPKL